ncbi:MAG: ABC1 kinase family protein [Phycisphaerales bacterium JB063]
MPLNNPITSTYRNTKRLAQVVGVLGRHGFSEVIEQLGLPGLIDKGLELVGRGPDAEHVKLPQHVRLRMVLEELGPTYIKMGQVLSTRPDLIAPELAEEFAKLQSDCPKLPFEDIRAMLVAELGQETLDTMFESIDETPLAAASMAQVHPARLIDGTDVVLKVLRPGIRKTIEADMEVLGEFARFAEDYFAQRGYSPSAVIREFADELHKELDLEHEARATRRLYRQFADDPGVSFPKVYPDASTQSVLCLERIHGQLLSRIDPDDLDDATRRAVVEHGADAVFRMCLKHGFFHADPHPGNLFVLEGGRICFIDCGMTGHIEQRTAEDLADLIQAVIDGDLDRTLRSVLSLSDADPSLSMDRGFRLDVWAYISRFQVEHLSELDLASLLNEFFVLLRKWKVQCPADLVFLIKAITTIQGVGAAVDPTFDLIGHVRPHIVRLVKRRYSIRAAKKRLLGSMRGYVELTEDLPEEIRAVVAHLKRKDFTVSLEHKGLDRLTNTIEHASRNLALALILASMLLSSAIFFAADNEQSSFGYLSVIGLISLLGCTGFGLFTLYAVYRRRK